MLKSVKEKYRLKYSNSYFTLNPKNAMSAFWFSIKTPKENLFSVKTFSKHEVEQKYNPFTQAESGGSSL